MPDLYLEMISTSDPRWKRFRHEHYIKSFSHELQQNLNAKEREKLGLKTGERGQQIHFLIWYKGDQVGIISGGSAVYGTALRDDFFHMPAAIADRKRVINSIVNNT